VVYIMCKNIVPVAQMLHHANSGIAHSNMLQAFSHISLLAIHEQLYIMILCYISTAFKTMSLNNLRIGQNATYLLFLVSCGPQYEHVLLQFYTLKIKYL